mmetsp:Transcript_5189/g.7672  ORF Transcript_5189/g.7672 Transcript_5189/m.7672 type:complete len:265 (+) Transcript_5189:52-846(+)
MPRKYNIKGIQQVQVPMQYEQYDEEAGDDVIMKGTSSNINTTKTYMSTSSSPMEIRMNWGNSQEATAILTALNYFHTIDPGVIIKEVGMCGAGLDYNSTLSGGSRDGECGFRGSDLILGASPDAVIEYSNGTLEVLEVKNHCPFVPTRRRTKDNVTIGDRYRIREMPMSPSVPSAYIPQLMMEMMCLGDNCRSAVMCRQTATNGAIIVRLRRDKEWINEMIYCLEKFSNDHVNKDVMPPPNFFCLMKIVKYQRGIRLLFDGQRS